MNCICKPWQGHHFPECPCQAAYERIREDELAKCSLTDVEAAQEGAALARGGWEQQSRRYRRIVRVPSGSSALTELTRLDPVRAGKITLAALELASKTMETEARQALRDHAETRELPLKVFEAFRKAKRGTPCI